LYLHTDFVTGKDMTTNTIQFYSDKSTEVLRLSKDGIWANPNVPVDDVAKLVLEALDYNIKVLVKKAVVNEREACAKVCDDHCGWTPRMIGSTIRARR
jgi:hypothetical protein